MSDIARYTTAPDGTLTLHPGGEFCCYRDYEKLREEYEETASSNNLAIERADKAQARIAELEAQLELDHNGSIELLYRIDFTPDGEGGDHTSYSPVRAVSMESAVKLQARIAELEDDVREYHREQQELVATRDGLIRERARTTVPFSTPWDTVVAALQTHIDSLRECTDLSLAEPLRDAEQTLARLREEELRTWRQDEEVKALRARIAELEALVGCVRGLIGCSEINVKDITPEKHSHEIVDVFYNQRARIAELEAQLKASAVAPSPGTFDNLGEANAFIRAIAAEIDRVNAVLGQRPEYSGKMLHECVRLRIAELESAHLATQRALVDYAKEAKCSRFATGSDDDGQDARHDAALNAARAAVAQADGKEAV